jgi:hypothetical protein
MAIEAEKLLTNLNAGAAPETQGDSTRVLAEFNLATQSEIARSFGDRFADEAIKLTPGNWTGPIYSAYGGHLLKVSERVEPSQPALADIRALVEREYLVKRRKEQKTLIYQKLREGYEVTIEPVKTAQGATGGMIATAQ